MKKTKVMFNNHILDHEVWIYNELINLDSRISSKISKFVDTLK